MDEDSYVHGVDEQNSAGPQISLLVAHIYYSNILEWTYLIFGLGVSQGKCDLLLLGTTALSLVNENQVSKEL